MSEKAKNKKRFIKLRYKYRLVLMDEENFEHRLSFRLSRLNVFSILALISLFWIALTIFVLAFTSIREYIPGYTDTSIQPQLYSLNQALDSLENEIYKNDLYIGNIKRILSGEDVYETDSLEKNQLSDYKKITNYKSEDDSLLRLELENMGKYNIYYHETEDIYDISFSKGPKVFFTPITGIITNEFNSSANHFGIDIVAKRNDAVKAIDDGIIIFAEWTINTGNIIAIQHSGNMVSIYKHNSSLLKKTGEYVNAGELIAIIGNTGEQSTGPHLHFELWIDGSAVDPKKYISF